MPIFPPLEVSDSNIENHKKGCNMKISLLKELPLNKIFNYPV